MSPQLRRKDALIWPPIARSVAMLLCTLALTLLGFSERATAAEFGRCPASGDAAAQVRSAEEFDASANDNRSAKAGGFRQKAAPFAPDIMLRLWYQERARNQGRARSHAIAQLARPDQIISVAHEPFGWQVSLRWNLVDIAETILPGDENQSRIYASDCAAFQHPYEDFFRLDEGDSLEAASTTGDPQARGELR
ncbi:hypothetical protein [Bradymonas sediminis]|uniref:Uncharacterized protein n=1 Tax=Bradymonas sediminis TaxID=1548548 RepID=A0A2Z4FME6_9DELT|nr:hypothetical protein [Bradymonas sediminis]AWV89995.1 hypothetical protein DN745_11860 [Bradymonas sediminis]TDP76049.1 hypothetical protein DFR33_103400 [Bradymonas sediminis]